MHRSLHTRSSMPPAPHLAETEELELEHVQHINSTTTTPRHPAAGDASAAAAAPPAAPPGQFTSPGAALDSGAVLVSQAVAAAVRRPPPPSPDRIQQVGVGGWQLQEPLALKRVARQLSAVSFVLSRARVTSGCPIGAPAGEPGRGGGRGARCDSRGAAPRGPER